MRTALWTRTFRSSHNSVAYRRGLKSVVVMALVVTGARGSTDAVAQSAPTAPTSPPKASRNGLPSESCPHAGVAWIKSRLEVGDPPTALELATACPDLALRPVEPIHAAEAAKTASLPAPPAFHASKKAALKASGWLTSGAPQPPSGVVGGGGMQALTASCGGASPALQWSTNQVLQVARESITFNAAGAAEVTTSALASLPAFNGAACHGSGADTVIAVVRATDGVVVATNDDTTGLASRVTFTASAWIPYTILVKAYGFAASGFVCSNPGTASITAKLGGVVVQTWTNRVFGGITVAPTDVETGDLFLAGKLDPSAGWTPDPAYHDLVIHAFSLPGGWDACSTGACGGYQMSDDWEGQLLPRASWATLATSSPQIVLGSYDYDDYVPGGPTPPRWVNGRLMQLRRHAADGGTRTCAENLDNDGDGLPWDLEQQLGTCDALDGSGGGTNIGVLTFGCGGFRAWLDAQVASIEGVACPATISGHCARHPIVAAGQPSNCWHPCDSDHDGFRDDEEVFIRRVGCQGVPDTLPSWQLSGCTRLFLSETFGNAYTTKLALALSAEDGPTPGTADVFVEVDAIKVGSADTGVTLAQRNVLATLYGTTGSLCMDGTAPPCAYASTFDLSYTIRMHTIQDEIHVLPYLPTAELVSFEGGVTLTTPGFLRSQSGAVRFLPARRDTGVYHYTTAYWDDGGQATSRRAVFGNQTRTAGATLATPAHEIGHMLSLSHGHQDAASPSTETCGDGGTMTQNEQPAFASLMNYAYGVYGMAALTDLGFGGPTCSTVNDRFSKGQANWVYQGYYATREDSVNELFGVTTLPYARLASDLRCFRRSQCSTWDPIYTASGCGGGTCCHDWNDDGSCQASQLPPIDVDRDDSWNAATGAPGQDGNRTNDRIRDRNDWAHMHVKMDDVLLDGPPGTVLMYATGFNDHTSADFTGWVPGVYTATLTSDPADFVDTGLETERCFVDSNCNLWNLGLGCLKDGCGQSSDCMNGQTCAGGTCTCATDADCFSGSCDQGACGLTDWGTCNCGIFGGRFPCSQYDAYRFGDALRVTQPSDTLALNYDASTMPALAMAAASFEIRADVRIDTFAPTYTTPQTIVDTGNVKLIAEPLGTTPALRSFIRLKVANASGQVVLSYPTVDLPALRVDRWHAVTLVRESDGTLDLDVWAWNVIDGLSEVGHDGYTRVACVSKSNPSVTANPSSVRFGATVPGTSALNGKLDNVSLMKGTGFDRTKAGCVAQ